MTRSHTSAFAAGWVMSSVSSARPAVLRRWLWQLTQYVLMTARGCACCSPATDGMAQPTPSATMAARHGMPASKRLTASRSHTKTPTSMGYTIRAMKHHLIATLAATTAAIVLAPAIFGQPPSPSASARQGQPSPSASARQGQPSPSASARQGQPSPSASARQGQPPSQRPAAPSGPATVPPVTAARLVSAQNEPDNWLMMNGDYGALRYSKLTGINRDNVKNLRLVWAMALGGMQDVGQNGPETEMHPLVDNGFLYTSDGGGTLYKIDARAPNKGEFVWVTDPGVKHQGNVSRTRGIALWEDLVIANIPDGRVIAVNRDTGEIVWDKMVASTNEFGKRERFYTAPITADGKVIVANSAGDGQTRGWIAGLDARTGTELWRWYVVPKPGDPGSETWKDTHNAWKTGGGGLWQTGSYDPATKLTIWGTGNPVPIYDPQFRPGDNLYTNSVVAVNVETGKLAWYFQYTPNDSWDFDEVGVHMLYDETLGGRS